MFIFCFSGFYVSDLPLYIDQTSMNEDTIILNLFVLKHNFHILVVLKSGLAGP